MNGFQLSKQKILAGVLAALFALLAGIESASACHQDPCPPYCEGKRCK